MLTSQRHPRPSASSQSPPKTYQRTPRAPPHRRHNSPQPRASRSHHQPSKKPADVPLSLLLPASDTMSRKLYRKLPPLPRAPPLGHHSKPLPPTSAKP